MTRCGARSGSINPNPPGLRPSQERRKPVRREPLFAQAPVLYCSTCGLGFVPRMGRALSGIARSAARRGR